MLDAPARPERRRWARILSPGAVVVSMCAAGLAQPAQAAGAVPSAPVFGEPFYNYDNPSNASDGTVQDLYVLDGSGTATGVVVRRNGGLPARDSGWTSTVLPYQPGASLRLTHLTPATTYTVYSRLVNANGSSPETAMTFRTASLPPAPASSAAALLKGGVKLSWADPGDCMPYKSFEGEPPWCTPTASNGGSAITGWKVSRDGTDTGGTGPWSTVVPRTDATGGYARVFSKTLSYLRPGVTYHVSVQAINKLGTGPAKTFTVVIPVVPAAPRIGTAVPGTAGGALNAKAVWTRPTNAGGTPTSYTVYAYRMGGTAVVETLTRSNVSSAATSYTFPLTRAGNYTFRVKATNAAGTSAYSAYSNVVAGR